MRDLFLAIVLLAGTPAIAQTINCTTSPSLRVDADGAPDSYRIDGRGLSHTCDGVFAIVDGVVHTQKNDKAHWEQLCESHWRRARASGDYSQVKIVGFEEDAHGKPVEQGPGDPLPGAAFVTTNTLFIPGTSSTMQRHFANASEIPYLVISGSYAARYHLGPGDLLAVFRGRNNRLAFAVYGDCCSMGEGSVRLHQDLGSNPISIDSDGVRRANRNIDDPVVLVALEGAHVTPTLDALSWRNQINVVGTAALARLGGLAAIKTCMGH